MGLLDGFRKENTEKINSLPKMYQLHHEGKHEEALKLHEKYFDKKSEGDWYTRGNLLSGLGQIQESLECYLKAIELKDTYVKAWLRAGQRYFELKEFSKARISFMKSSQLEKNIGENEWNTLATFYFMMSLYFEYLETKDSEIRVKVSNQIKKLRKIIDYDKKSTEEEFLNYCSENFQKIITELEPKIVMEFRTPDSNN